MKLPTFKKTKSFRKGGFHTNPDIVWEIILYIAFAAIIFFLAYGYYLFVQVNKDFVVPAVDTTGGIKIVTKVRIDKVLEIFSARDAKSTDILNSPSPVVDPSL